MKPILSFDMNNEQKNIIITGIKDAGTKIKNQLWFLQNESLTKVTSFDYGIPADKEAERIILKAIQETKLNCQLISEESDIIWESDAEYTIYLDPLDGSVNFSRGIPAFCIGVGVYKWTTPVLGIIYDISLNELFIAEIGKGVFLNGIQLYSPNIGPNLLINLEWFGAPTYEEVVTKLKKVGIRARTSWSWVLALCYGCIWRGDGAILLSNSPWDIAPGLVFAREFGHTIKQTSGHDVNLTQRRQDVIVGPSIIFDTLQKVFS